MSRRLLNASLLLAAIALAVAVAWSLLAPLRPPTPIAPAAPPLAADPGQAADVEALEPPERDIFGHGPSAETPAAETGGRLSVLGVVLGPRASFVLVRDGEGGAVRRVHVGEKVDGKVVEGFDEQFLRLRAADGSRALIPVAP